MKRFCALCITLCTLPGLASQSLTVGDTLTLYFSELLPHPESSAESIVLKFTDIGNRPGLYSALQKGIYYGMIPNTASDLRADAIMTDKMFGAILKKHFGISTQSDTSALTPSDYDSFMDQVRSTYSYALLHELNRQASSPDTTQKQLSRLESAKNYYILSETYSILRDKHIDTAQISDEDLVIGAAQGIAQSTGDIYTQYFDAETAVKFHDSLSGKTAGIGIMVSIDTTESLKIDAVIAGSPAEKEGLKKGDKIIKIGEQKINTRDGIEDEILSIRGVEGTPVTITFVIDRIVESKTLTRASIQIPPVSEASTNTTYLITYRDFSTGSDEILRSALENFINSGRKRLILDLRNNPGGGMIEAKNILNFFINKDNPLVILRYPKTEEVFTASKKNMTDWSQYEIIIMTNEQTASAGEILAAVLREYFPRNLRLIGKKTYGKGVVQELVSFDDKSLLKYTVAEWITPKNRLSINKNGVKPDVNAEFDTELWKTSGVDTQLQAAFKYNF